MTHLPSTARNPEGAFRSCPNPYQVLDLFSGIGGFSLGLERTGGFKTVAFCEIEPFPRRVLKKHWPEVPIYEDVRTLTAAQLAADGIGVDVICGGFPCQDISVAGLGAGIDGERSGLWSEYHRLIGELRPLFALIENVPALRTRGADRVLGDLETLGYACEPIVVGAIHVGAPHRRQRAWLVAHARSRILRLEQGWSGRQGRESAPIAGHDGAAEPLADASRFQPGWAEQWPQRERTRQGGQSFDLANPDSAGRQQQWRAVSVSTQLAPAERGGWWFTEPNVGRVAARVPSRVDRLRALGNAVVPQIPELIGRAILASEQREAA
jgi:DNA (cytosine-5)-methyltransferase 1